MNQSARWYAKNPVVALLLAGVVVALGACASPFEQRASENLRASVLDAAERELRPLDDAPEQRTLTRRASELSFDPEIEEELLRMAGPQTYREIDAVMAGDIKEDLTQQQIDEIVAEEPMLIRSGEDLLGRETRLFRLNLQRAIAAAVDNNLNVQSARISPAIGSADVIAAEAVFDWVFFANFNWDRTDEPNFVPVIGGIPVGTPAAVQDSVGYDTGIRRVLTSGGTLSISQGQQYRDSKTSGTQFNPDPGNRAFLSIDYTQPLLRGFGSDVALAEVRLARNSERRAVHELEQSLIETVTNVERAYWNLFFAQRSLQVQRRLLMRGIATRNVLRSRLEFDVRPAEFSDAVATVEQRRGLVIEAFNDVRQASDTLKALINDPELTVADETVLLAIDDPVSEPLTYSLLDAVSTGLDRRPEVRQALLSIDDASIRQTVASNARLPQLDLGFNATFQGLDEGVDDAYEDVGESRFVNWLLSLAFEQPIGNRAAEAGYRRSQLVRLQASVGYRSVVQQVVLQVKTALRDISTNYRLIEQRRTSRLAATENLRTLLVQERTIQSLTPDFLDLKFSRQELLAQAELDELRSLVEYNIALADYHAATGTALSRNRIRLVVPNADDALLDAR